MSITLGRVGRDITFNNPSSLSRAGGILTMDGPIRSTTLANMKVLRDQLLGHGDNPWEPVIPFTASFDASLDGYYRVLDISVGTPTFGYKASGFGSYSVKLERVRAYGFPIFESVLNGAARNGATGTPLTFYAIPATWDYYGQPGLTSHGATSFGSPGGSVYSFTDATDYYTARPQWYSPPASFYDSASTIKADSFVVVGQDFPRSLTTWELGNGILKVSGNGAGQFSVTSPTGILGTSYGTAFDFTVGFYNGTNVTAVSMDQPVILRNTPEGSAIRLRGAFVGAFGRAMYTTDLLLRRGAFNFEIVLQSTEALKLGVDITNTNTALGGADFGLVATSTDANGNKIFVVSSKGPGVGLNAANGYMYLSSNGNFHDLALGYDTGITGTPGYADSIQHYWAAITETQAVVTP